MDAFPSSKETQQGRGRGRGRGRGTGRGWIPRTERALPQKIRGYNLKGYRKALEVAIEFAIRQDAILTAYNCINAVRNEEVSIIKNLSLYAPRDIAMETFLDQMLQAIRDSGLEEGEVFLRPPHPDTGVAFIMYGEAAAATDTFVLVTASTFPDVQGTPPWPLDEITWSLPVTCCGLTWHPRLLLPPLQERAFQFNFKLQDLYVKGVADREATGANFPHDKIRAWAAAQTVRKVPTVLPPLADNHAYMMDFPNADTYNFKLSIAMDSWDLMKDLTDWLIGFPQFPYHLFNFPAHVDIATLGYLHAAARQELEIKPRAALDCYIYASRMSITHRVGLWVLLTLPLFVGPSSYRDMALQDCGASVVHMSPF